MSYFKILFYTICISFSLLGVDNSSCTIKLTKFNDVYYFSAKEFSQKFDIKLIHYEDKSKLEFFCAIIDCNKYS